MVARFIHPVDKNDVGAQVRMAAQCCKLADIMISQSDTLWMVPQRLIDQTRRTACVNGGGGAAGRRQIARKSKSITNPADIRLFNAKHVHKIVI